MADFDIFLPILLKNEGGYVNNPNDPGGETNKGITINTFVAYSQSLLGVAPTSDNLKALTDTQAGVIYKARYWNAVSGDSFLLQDLANIVCDFYVNAGTHASKLLQTVMNSLGANVTVDGGIGPASMAALANLDQVAVYQAYKQGRINYYEALAVTEPTFLKGWLNRTNSFPDLSDPGLAPSQQQDA
jgi:lysozyme family protein